MERKQNEVKGPGRLRIPFGIPFGIRIKILIPTTIKLSKMKLKQLMSSSLPRRKNKSKSKKEKQDKNNQSSNNNNVINNNKNIHDAPLAVVTDPPEAVKDKGSTIKERDASKMVEGRKEGRVGAGVITLPTIKVMKYKSKASVSLNEPLMASDFHLIKEKMAPAGPDSSVFNVNFNLNTGDGKCACYKHINPTYSPDPTERLAFSLGDTNHESAPRTRTRIRTNPWLPSPRTSPSVSTASSMDTSPSEARDFHGENTKVKEGVNILSRDRLGVSAVNSAVCQQLTDLEQSYTSLNIKTAEADCQGDLLHGSMQTSFASETDNSIYATIPSRPSSPYFPIPIVEAEGVSSCDSINTEIAEKIVDPKHLEDQVSFQYEEAFESQVEAHCDDFLDTSSDDVSDGYGSRDDVFLDSSQLSLGYDSDTERSIESASFCKESALECYSSGTEEEIVWKLREDSAAETDDTLCDEPRRFRQNLFMSYERRVIESRPLKHTVFSAKGDKKISEHHDAKSVGSCSADSGACSEGSSLGMGSSSHRTSELTTRTVGEIQSSLQIKVNKLRMEKLVVDEKIRRAQEEERLREQEKRRFQKQLTLHRKQILLRTLQDLKQKLENQSQRLQTTYSSVLTIQKNFLRGQKKYLRAHEIQDFQEAPF